MISFKNVTKVYVDGINPTIGLRNINVDIEESGVIAVVGESGSGKSTFLKLLAKLDSPTEGEIIIDGKNTADYDLDEMDEYRYQNISFVHQQFNVIEGISVLNNIMMPLLIRNVSKDIAKKKALDLITKVGLDSVKNKTCNKLSGGEKQRVAIARALIVDSRIIACDEPTGNLDFDTSKQIIDLLYSLTKDRLLIIITHSFEEVKDIADRKLVFYDNEIVEDVLLTKEAKNIEKKEAKASSLSVSKMAGFSFFNMISNKSRLIFMGLSMIISIALIFMGIVAINVSLNEKKYYNNFINTRENSVYVTSGNVSGIDNKLLNDYEEYNINPVEELKSVLVTFGNEKSQYLYYSMDNYELIAGHYPENNNEVCISISGNSNVDKSSLLRNDSDFNDTNDYLEKTIKIGKCETEYKIVGVSTGAKYDCLFGNRDVQLLMKASLLDFGFIIYYLDTDYLFPTSMVANSDIVVSDSDRIKITLPRRTMFSNVHGFGYALSNKTYIYDESMVDIVYLDDQDDPDLESHYGIIEIPRNFEFDHIEDVIIYGVNTNEEISKWDSLYYYAVDPMNYSLQNGTFENTRIYVSVFVSIGILVLSFIVFTFLDSLLFNLKMRDYLILNQLGLRVNKLKLCVFFEYLFFMILALVVVFVVGLIVALNIFSNINVLLVIMFTIILSIIYTLINAYASSKQLNKHKSLLGKGGVL